MIPIIYLKGCVAKHCRFLLFLCFCIPVTYAENAALSLDRIKLAIEKGEHDFLYHQLPIFIINTGSLPESEYVKSSINTSVMLREKNQSEVAQWISKWLSSDEAKEMKDAVRFRWMMVINYDLMFFTEFSVAKTMLEKDLEAIKSWKPETTASKEHQANLYHSYGQLLVREKHIAKALPYFYQAEKWFTEIKANHTALFSINVILGEAFLHANDYKKAEEYSYKALDLIPEGRVDGVSYLNAILASALEQQQRPQDAIKVITNYLSNPIDPRKDYFLYFSLVHLDVLRALGKFEDAFVLANETYALAQYIGNKDYLKDASRHLGFLQAHFGDTVSAEALLKEAIYSPSDLRQKNSAHAYFDYVQVLEKLGKYQAALDYYRLYHETYIEEQERISQITIANLELHQENQRLEQKQGMSEMKLALAKANENRTQLKNYVLVLTAIILFIIVTVMLVVFIQMRRKNRQLHDMAVSDQLTELGNRHSFSKALNDLSYVMLVIVDIDSLKYYNDNYGHQKGDEFIKHYAEQMKKVLANHDVRLFRVGGDEFAILIDHAISADTIRQWMIDIIQLTKKQGFEKVDASYGMAMRNEADNNLDWVSLADQRMYEMKNIKKVDM